MITMEELDKLVKAEFDGYAYTLKNWESVKPTLTPHIEQVPGAHFVNEYGSEDWEWEEELCSYAQTYDDDIAYFCWKCGCHLSTHIDYWDGSPTYYLSMPSTEEEYQKNLAEAKKWWNEVMGE